MPVGVWAENAGWRGGAENVCGGVGVWAENACGGVGV